MNDVQIINAIQNGGIEEHKAMCYLIKSKAYKAKAENAFRRARQLRLVSGDDIFQEAIIEFICKLKNKSFHVDTKLIHYFGGICNNLCLVHLRKENKEDKFSKFDFDLDIINDEHTPFKITLRNELKDALREAIASIDEKCQQLLRLWMLNYSSDEIVKATGISNNDVVRNTIKRCKQKLRKKLEQNKVLTMKLKDLRWI